MVQARVQRIARGAGAACAAIGVSALLAACGGGSQESARVAASAPALELLARDLGGDQLEVIALTPAGGQPHDLAPGAAGNAALQRASAVLYLGGGFQPKIEEAVGRLPRQTARLDLLGAATLPSPASVDGIDGVPPVTEGEPDPHVWLDPVRYGEMAQRAAQLLSDAELGDADELRRRAGRVLAEARTLDAEYRAGLAGCAGRSIITNHPAWTYVAERYGMRQAFVGGITAAARPQARSLRAAAREARRSGATTLVTTIPLPSRIAEQVQRETGLRSVVLDPLESLATDAGGRRLGYAAVMRSNLAALRGALGCGDDAAGATSPPPAIDPGATTPTPPS